MPSFDRVRQWLRREPPLEAPFSVRCRCGEPCTGKRTRSYQQIPCSQCGRAVFVLPCSPFQNRVETPQANATTSVDLSSYPMWVKPAVAAGACLVLIVGGYLLLISSLLSVPKETQTFKNDTNVNVKIKEKWAAGAKAMNAGNFRLAHDHLSEAIKLLEGQPGALPKPEQRKLRQEHRQAALMVDWPREPLDLVLARFARLKQKEWDTVVAAYRGRGMVFDVGVRRGLAGDYHVTFRRPDLAKMIRLDLNGLEVLNYLPLQDNQRLLLGARLAGIQRKGPDWYVVKVQPDSGVLVTHPAVVKECALIADNEGLEDVVANQRKWLVDVP